MAGVNQIIKKGTVVFSEGDRSNGMYLIRSGELQVYLNRDNNDVQLATIGAGGMIGEMAFFEQKPRSASVKALSDTEVTLITNDDFGKLMKQIPKWFVSIMSSLSARLRDTNERLQKLEALQSGHRSRYETLIKVLHVLNLIWSKDGVKEDKAWCLNKQAAEDLLISIFKMERENVSKILTALVNSKLLSTKMDDYKNALLTIQNRAAISRFTQFVETFTTAQKNISALPDPALDMLRILQKLVAESAYDNAVIVFEDVVDEGKRQGLDTSAWDSHLPLLQRSSNGLQLTKIASNQTGFKTNQKDITQLLSDHLVLASLAKAGVDR